MSNPTFKAPRDLDTIRNEYTGLCAKAGHTQYQIATLQKDLQVFNDALRDLNAESIAAQQATADAAQKAKVEAESSKPKEEPEVLPPVKSVRSKKLNSVKEEVQNG